MQITMSPVPPPDTTLDAMPSIVEEYPPDSPSNSTTVPHTLGPGSPSHDTSPDSVLRRTVRRRRSRLELWIDEQCGAHVAGGSADDRSSIRPPVKADTSSYAYLAYPGLRPPRSPFRNPDRASTVENVVLVDEDEAGTSSRGHQHDVFQSHPINLTSATQSSIAVDGHSDHRPYSRLFHAPPSLRNFHIALSPSRRASAASAHNISVAGTPRSTILQRHSTSMGHTRGLSVGSIVDQPSTPQTPSTPRSSRSFVGSWKFKRPTVLGAFTSSEASVEEDESLHLAPPRPSFSSTHTFSSGTTGASTDVSTPLKGPSSIRLSPSTHPKSSTPSLWSLPRDASHMQDPPDSEATVSLKPGTIRLPFSIKAHGNTMPALRHVPSMLAIPKDKRKKKLIVSGIGVGDERRYQSVKQWCETFGEVNQITRMPNGDLHVDFRKAEVADTVCRINARVFIAKVGSVSLSWYTGKKP